VKLSPLREPLNIAFHLISPSPHPQPSEPVVHAFLTVASGTAIASSQPRLTPSVALTRRFGGSSRARLSRKHPERTSVKKCGPCRRPNPLGQPASTSVSRHRTRHSERAAPTSVRCSRPCHSLIRQSTAAWKFPAVRAFHVKHRTRAPRPNRAPHAAMTSFKASRLVAVIVPRTSCGPESSHRPSAPIGLVQISVGSLRIVVRPCVRPPARGEVVSECVDLASSGARGWISPFRAHIRRPAAAVSRRGGWLTSSAAASTQVRPAMRAAVPSELGHAGPFSPSPSDSADAVDRAPCERERQARPVADVTRQTVGPGGRPCTTAGYTGQSLSTERSLSVPGAAPPLPADAKDHVCDESLAQSLLFHVKHSSRAGGRPRHPPRW
jgi:hypothetical protein